MVSLQGPRNAETGNSSYWFNAIAVIALSPVGAKTVLMGHLPHFCE